MMDNDCKSKDNFIEVIEGFSNKYLNLFAIEYLTR